MRAIYGPTTGGAWLLTAVLAASACHPTPSTVRSPGLDRQLEALTLAAERDSLIMEVAANGRLLNDLEAELRKAAPRPAAGQPESPELQVTTDQRTFVLEQVRSVTSRLKGAELRLSQSERRARRLVYQVDSLSTGLTDAQASLADLVAIVGQQREQVAALTLQLGELTGLTETLGDSVHQLTDDRNTAYFVVGTRDELIRQGVLVPEGPRNVPLVGKRQAVPARALPLQAFTSIDRSAIHEIPLPDTTRRYRIVSRQNLAYLASTADRKGTVQERIAIADAEGFWEPSKYLIVVEQ